MEAVVALGHRMLADAHLPAQLAAVCAAALGKRGRLFSDTPTCARLSLGWIDALAPERRGHLYPAVVAGDCMVAGYDLLDTIYDQDDNEQTRRRLLPAGITLLNLAQECMRRADAPADRRMAAAAALAHGGRRAFAGHLRDYERRGGPPADAATLLWIIRERSGSLVAASCGAAAIVAGGTWRQVGLAARFGRAFAVAAQLEDDFDDRQVDAQAGRQTIPTLLAAGTSDAAVRATTWVLMRQSLRTAAAALARLHTEPTMGTTEGLWQLLPAVLRQPSATPDSPPRAPVATTAIA
jgi:hypothetical protein